MFPFSSFDNSEQLFAPDGNSHARRFEGHQQFLLLHYFLPDVRQPRQIVGGGAVGAFEGLHGRWGRGRNSTAAASVPFPMYRRRQKPPVQLPHPGRVDNSGPGPDGGGFLSCGWLLRAE